MKNKLLFSSQVILSVLNLWDFEAAKIHISKCFDINWNLTEKQTWIYLRLWHWSTLGPQQRPLQERWHFWPAHKDRNDQRFGCDASEPVCAVFILWKTLP